MPGARGTLEHHTIADAIRVIDYLATKKRFTSGMVQGLTLDPRPIVILLLLRGGIALETAQPYVCYTLSYCAILESGLKDLGLSREEHTSSRKLVRMPLLYRYETLSDVPVHKAWLGSLVKRAGGLRRERSTVLPCQEWSVRHCQARSCRALQRRTKPREPPEIPELLSTWNSGPYRPMDAARTPKVYQALFMPVLSCSRGRARLAWRL